MESFKEITISPIDGEEAISNTSEIENSLISLTKEYVEEVAKTGATVFFKVCRFRDHIKERNFMFEFCGVGSPKRKYGYTEIQLEAIKKDINLKLDKAIEKII